MTTMPPRNMADISLKTTSHHKLSFTFRIRASRS